MGWVRRGLWRSSVPTSLLKQGPLEQIFCVCIWTAFECLHGRRQCPQSPWTLCSSAQWPSQQYSSSPCQMGTLPVLQVMVIAPWMSSVCLCSWLYPVPSQHSFTKGCFMGFVWLLFFTAIDKKILDSGKMGGNRITSWMTFRSEDSIPTCSWVPSNRL